jgi:putative holliday junction resolvase
VLKTPGMRALGLDVGSKTIGVAVSDPSGTIASPRQVLTRRGHAEDAAAVAALARELEAGAVVVGLPLELDGSVGHRARQVQRFLALLEPALSALPGSPRAYTWDERFSTAGAERALLQADVSRARRKQVIDAAAAQFILQGWLDGQRRKDMSGETGT